MALGLATIRFIYCAIATVIKIINHARWSGDLIANPVAAVVIYPIRRTKVIRRVIKVIGTIDPIVRAVIKVIGAVYPIIWRVIKVHDPLSKGALRKD